MGGIVGHADVKSSYQKTYTPESFRPALSPCHCHARAHVERADYDDEYEDSDDDDDDGNDGLNDGDDDEDDCTVMFMMTMI